jgi:hypothetical protein
MSMFHYFKKGEELDIDLTQKENEKKLSDKLGRR